MMHTRRAVLFVVLTGLVCLCMGQAGMNFFQEFYISDSNFAADEFGSTLV